MYTAYGNTEYQTHYLNLAYTPAKAISLLIASKAFHRLPRGKTYGRYPADSVFDVFRVSYKEQLSEMNSEEDFYYSSSTHTIPKDPAKLQHLAGVGNSPVVRYAGTGAYFLDKVGKDLWRLELMPDAVSLKDPFEKASPAKTVTAIQWKEHTIQILLPMTTKDFYVQVDDGRHVKVGAGEGFDITPGVYLIRASMDGNVPTAAYKNSYGFAAPPASTGELMVVHQPPYAMTAAKMQMLSAQILNADSSDRVSFELRNASNVWKTVVASAEPANRWEAQLPAEILSPGMINYRILVRKANGETYSFPGGYKGNPYAWDEYRNESWQVFVAAPGSSMELFNATADRNRLMLYTTDWRNNKVEGIAGETPGSLFLHTAMTKPNAGQMMGWQFFFGDKINGRRQELESFTKLVVRARAAGADSVRLSLLDADGQAYGTWLEVSGQWQELELPLDRLKPGAFLLLPRPYPGFQSLWSGPVANKAFQIGDVERVELRFQAKTGEAAMVDVEWVRLR